MSGLLPLELTFELSEAVPVTAPEPGDAAYKDHIAEMLARLPEQFKEKRQ